MSKRGGENNLNDQQERFCLEYIIDLNATKAAERAGYAVDSADVQGSRLLSNVKVKARIDELKLERGIRTKVTADKVIEELELMAMWDPADYINIRSPEDILALPKEKRIAIVGWGWNKQGDFELKFAKPAFFQMLGRHHKLFVDQVEVSGTVNLAERLAKARKKKQD